MASVLSAPVREALVCDLRALIGDRATTNATQLEHHSHGESWHDHAAPDVVVFPSSTDEVSAVMKVAARHRRAGHSLRHRILARGTRQRVQRRDVIDFSKMSRVLAVNADDLDATVEAGVTHRQLNKALNNTGLAFWVDPGADATIGGMAATRASGTTAVRYGTMREAVLGLTVVLADGRIIPHGSRARKSPAAMTSRAVRRLGRHARGHHRDHGPSVRPPGSGFRGGVSIRRAWKAPCRR
jgi:D-lactate dehydrogenase (cytochrome)